ncbi:3-alpha,7-alpha,12-alpha-trihydroxy-5-beta-cholest-24-enoyl-CoA hydratase [Ochrobactrum sp. XJ1]|nr:3-alpha,7-alpha,12-alpha-trihydroxy-5-beta-cholest-24-enoyl-CoA hydratase [Ochrobactrum sp. XJ1]
MTQATPLNTKRITEHQFAERTASYKDRDVILYALCCGAGADGDLTFVHEDYLKVIPSFGQNLCFDDSWMEESGIDLPRVVHGGLDLRMHKPFKVGGSVQVQSRIAGLTDKGEGRPAFVLHQSDVKDGDDVVFTSYSNLFVMGGGGFGGSQGETFEMVRLPETAPTSTAVVATRADSPVLFRLLGDLNPLHVKPDVAKQAGFDRPIMHGANTFGYVCHDVVLRFCGGDPARLKRFAARFSGPFFPGEQLALSYWAVDGGVRFAARSVERDAPVLDGGVAEII